MPKEMHKIVLDTNVLVSALLFGGVPRELLGRILAGQVAAVISPALTEELLGILRAKFDLTNAELAAMQRGVLDTFTLVMTYEIVTVLKDEPDNRVLEVAVEGECDSIVTGDKQFLALKMFRGIPILSPRQFLDTV